MSPDPPNLVVGPPLVCERFYREHGNKTYGPKSVIDLTLCTDAVTHLYSHQNGHEVLYIFYNTSENDSGPS